MFPYQDVTLEQDVGLISPRNDSGFPSYNQGVTLEQEVLERDDSSISPNVELQPGLKSPSSLSAWLSNMPTPQHDVYVSAVWSDPKNIKSVNNVTETSVYCCSLAFVTPCSKTAMHGINPCHKYKPNYKSGRHPSAGKDASTFDVCMAAKMASSSEVESKVILMGNPISCCHAPVVRSFFIHCKMIISP